jgi:hypothetical protein
VLLVDAGTACTARSRFCRLKKIIFISALGRAESKPELHPGLHIVSILAME